MAQFNFTSNLQEEIPIKIIKLYDDYNRIFDALFTEKEEANRGIERALDTMHKLGFECKEIEEAKACIQERFNRNIRYKLFCMKESIEQILEEIPKGSHDLI